MCECRSGGETTAASHSRDSLRLGGEEKRQRQWAELVCLKCVHVLYDYGDEEQCFHSYRHLQAKVTL